MMLIEVDKFEEDFKIQLPTDSRNFLIENNGEEFSFEYFPIEVIVDEELKDFGIVDFESLLYIRLATESLRELSIENIDENQIYIADIDCFVELTVDVYGFILLLGVKNEYFGKVYLLDRDPIGSTGEVRKFLIADSFSELLDKIKSRDATTPDSNRIIFG